MEFLEKLQRVCGQIPGTSLMQPVLSSPGPCRLVVGNWSLSCQKEGEVAIRNSDGTRVSPRLLVYYSGIMYIGISCECKLSHTLN